MPHNCLDAKLLQYAEWGRLGKQIDKLSDIFESKQVKVIVFDDFIDNTRAVYDDVLSFLEVPSDNRSNFPRVNANAKYRLPRLNLLFLRLRRSSSYRRLAERIKEVVDVHPYKWFTRLNRVRVERTSISDEFRDELVMEFRDDVKKLSGLIGRDLSHWLG